MSTWNVYPESMLYSLGSSLGRTLPSYRRIRKVFWSIETVARGRPYTRKAATIPTHSRVYNKE